MIRRTTENYHAFTAQLYQALDAYSIENLAMDNNRNFTALIEAVQFDDGESIDITNVFTTQEIEAKLVLASNLCVPFYYVCYISNTFIIYQVVSATNCKMLYQFDANAFVSWWAQIKGTTQTHPLVNGANIRTGKTIFDSVIEASGQAWGGNVDGFIVRNGVILAVIDNISIAFVPITDTRADPARFFFKKGPKYETWYSTVKLAATLRVPHFLLTIDKNNPNNQIVGISVIDKLTTGGDFLSFRYHATTTNR